MKTVYLKSVLPFFLLSSASGFSATVNSTVDGSIGIKAIPYNRIDLNCDPDKVPYKTVILRFGGISINTDGRLRMKRNIKFEDKNAPESQDVGGIDVPNDPKKGTPFDVSVKNNKPAGNYIRIKLIVDRGVGATFMRDLKDEVPGDEYAYVRTQKNKADFFCGLKKIVEKDKNDSQKWRQVITFNVKPVDSAGFAVGINVPEIDSATGVLTGRVLPLIIDPIVENEG